MFSQFTGLWFLPNSRNLINGGAKFERKIYVALAFPEIFKVAAVLLQIFDDEPTLLLLIGLLIISIQLTSLESVTSISPHKLNTIIFVAALLRFLVRCLFHNRQNVWLLGMVSWFDLTWSDLTTSIFSVARDMNIFDRIHEFEGERFFPWVDLGIKRNHVGEEKRKKWSKRKKEERWKG